MVVAEKKFVLPNLISINRLPEAEAPNAITATYYALWFNVTFPPASRELKCRPNKISVGASHGERAKQHKVCVVMLKTESPQQDPDLRKSWRLSAEPSRASAPFSPVSSGPLKWSGTRCSTILLTVHAVNSGIYGLIRLENHRAVCLALPSLPESVLFLISAWLASSR
jgi:hypothetical protein